MSKNPHSVLKERRKSTLKDRRKSSDSMKNTSASLMVESEILHRRTLFALAFMAAVLLALLFWTAIVPDSLFFALA